MNVRLAPQVERAHYGHGYDDAPRLALHRSVLREALSVDGNSVLEIGLGSGHVTRALQAAGRRVVTLDIAADLRPTVRGSVTHLPFRAGAFDVALAEEVLEHVPFDLAQAAMRELARVARRRVVISVPQFGLATRAKLRWTKAAHGLRGGQHYWTLGCNEVRARDVRRALAAAGLAVEKDLGANPLRPVPFARGWLARLYPRSRALRTFAAWRLFTCRPVSARRST